MLATLEALKVDAIGLSHRIDGEIDLEEARNLPCHTGVVLIALGSAYFEPAAQAALPNVVAEEDLGRANVLMGATMSVEVAARQVPGGTPGGDAVARVRASLIRLQEFSQKILRFTRPAAAALQPVELAPWAKRVAAEVSVPLPGSANLSVSIQNGVVLADVALLDQAVMNLIINARDAGATEINFAVECSRGQVRISVEDNGGGIPPAMRDKLFEPLATTKAKGNGLGLSLVYSVAAEHDGEIEVESTAGEGTKFTIILKSVVAERPRGA